jgi:hypothetical protein
MKKKINKFLLCIFFVFISFNTYSKDPVPPGPAPPPGLPIDGGLSFLIIAGTVYGIFELRRKKQ